MSAQAVIKILAGKFPNCFLIDPHSKEHKPLKKHITNDIIESGVVPAHKVKSGLFLYCRRIQYLKALRDGRERVDLQGMPTGSFPDESDKKYARKLLAERHERLKQKQRQKNQSADAPALAQAERPS